MSNINYYTRYVVSNFNDVVSELKYMGKLDGFTYREFQEAVTVANICRMPLASASSVLSHIYANYPQLKMERHKNYKGVYIYSLVEHCISILDKPIKEQSKLKFAVDETGGEIYFDFSTKTFNKEIGNYRINDQSCRGAFVEEIFNALDYEWIYNYSDDWIELFRISKSCKELKLTSCPKGLINYLTEQDLVFTNVTVREYVLRERYGTTIYNFITKFGYQNYLLLENNGDFNNLKKSLITTVKQGNFELPSITIRGFLNRYEKAKKLYPDFNFINPELSILENDTNLVNKLNEEKTKFLNQELKRINFINGFTQNGYIVVVPQCLEDLQEEGRQQHNCVGSYYNESVIDKQNYLFFVRDVDNISRSYITCRFNVPQRSVCEYREFSNTTVKDNTAINFINTVNKMLIDNFDNWYN